MACAPVEVLPQPASMPVLLQVALLVLLLGWTQPEAARPLAVRLVERPASVVALRAQPLQALPLQALPSALRPGSSA